MIFIDSNVPIYLLGAMHPHKFDSQRLLETCISNEERLVTDTEVFQEILHRYVAIEQRDAIQPTFETLLRVVDEVFPVEFRDVARAKEIVLTIEKLSARNAIHLAVMERQGIDRILILIQASTIFQGYLDSLVSRTFFSQGLTLHSCTCSAIQTLMMDCLGTL